MEQPVEYNYFLPIEILINIFSFIERRTLVYNCRAVCKFWKEVVECTDVWKTQICREAKPLTSELEDILPTAHLNYPWYMCYVLCKNIFYKNLLPDYCFVDNMSYWRDVLNRSTGRVCSGRLQSHSQGYNVAPQGLLDEGVTNCLLISFGDCCLNQITDLYRCGFTRKSFEFCPPIHISEWFAVGYHFFGTYHLEVSFFDSQWKRDNENGLFRYVRHLENRECHKVAHTFTNYRPDVRYIIFSHGIHTFLGSMSGRYREIVNFGNAAAKLAGVKLTVTLPQPRGSSDYLE